MTVTYSRVGDLDLAALGVPATAVAQGGTVTFTSDDVDLPTLQAAVDALPLASVRAAAQATQDTAVHQLLTGAQALLARLDGYHTDLVTRGQAQAAAKAALTAKIGNLPAAPTAAQVGTFLRSDLAAYLLALDTTAVTVGTDLDHTITELGATVRALGNLIARQTGDPTTL